MPISQSTKLKTIQSVLFSENNVETAIAGSASSHTGIWASPLRPYIPLFNINYVYLQPGASYIVECWGNRTDGNPDGVQFGQLRFAPIFASYEPPDEALFGVMTSIIIGSIILAASGGLSSIITQNLLRFIGSSFTNSIIASGVERAISFASNEVMDSIIKDLNNIPQGEQELLPTILSRTSESTIYGTTTSLVSGRGWYREKIENQQSIIRSTFIFDDNDETIITTNNGDVGETRKNISIQRESDSFNQFAIHSPIILNGVDNYTPGGEIIYWRILAVFN